MQSVAEKVFEGDFFQYPKLRDFAVVFGAEDFLGLPFVPEGLCALCEVFGLIADQECCCIYEQECASCFAYGFDNGVKVSN